MYKNIVTEKSKQENKLIMYLYNFVFILINKQIADDIVFHTLMQCFALHLNIKYFITWIQGYPEGGMSEAVALSAEGRVAPQLGRDNIFK